MIFIDVTAMRCVPNFVVVLYIYHELNNGRWDCHSGYICCRYHSIGLKVCGSDVERSRLGGGGWWVVGDLCECD